MMVQTDGDPTVSFDGVGLTIDIEDGQPDMDEGLRNAVTLSLFGPSSWWGNSISSNAEKFNSHFLEIRSRNLTNQTRLDAEEYAKNALAWMTSEKVAQSISIEATLPQIGWLVLQIEIIQPDKKTSIKYSINWAAMAVRVGI